MKNFLLKIYAWLKVSNRWKHLVLAILISVFANSWYCAIYTGIVAASALEFKDISWKGQWDWSDWLMTLTGFIVGYGIFSLLGLIF